MKKNFFQLRKKNNKPDSTNLEYAESSSNDFVAQMPMFTKLDSNILLLLFFIFDTSYKIFVLMEDQLTPMSM